jgi:transcriptional regulator with XRE-family HTH domain
MEKFRAVIKLRNNRLMSLRQERGLTIKELADLAGVSRCLLCSLECLKYNAFRHGVYTPLALKVSSYLNVDPSWLFEGALSKSFEPQKLKAEIKFDGKAIEYKAAQKLIPMDLMEDVERLADTSLKKKHLNKYLNTLDDLHRGVIIDYFIEEKTLEEIGKKNNITRDYARIVKDRAMKLLRRAFMRDNTSWGQIF